MLVMTAILLVVIIGLAALAIDVGSFYQAQRQAQAAADAGALAGADALVGGASAASATSTATTLANTNYPSTTTPTATVNGQTITVNVANTTPAYFGRIFGVTSADVGARAVASATSSYAPCGSPGSSCYAVFAMDSSCSASGVSSTAGNITLNGGVHSNGSISINANNGFGPTSFGPTASGCKASTGSNDTFTSGPTSGPVLTAWPIDYSVTYPACGASMPTQCTGPGGTPSYCNYAAASYIFTTQPTTGIYCAYGTGTPADPGTYTGAISFPGNFSATASYIGGSINVTGSVSFTPYTNTATNKLLFYAAGTGSGGLSPAIYLNAGGSTYGGHMFAPNGMIYVGAGKNSTSFLEGKDVVLAAGAMTITGSGPQVPSGGSNPSGVASLTQ